MLVQPKTTKILTLDDVDSRVRRSLAGLFSITDSFLGGYKVGAESDTVAFKATPQTDRSVRTVAYAVAFLNDYTSNVEVSASTSGLESGQGDDGAADLSLSDKRYGAALLFGPPRSYKALKTYTIIATTRNFNAASVELGALIFAP